MLLGVQHQHTAKTVQDLQLQAATSSSNRGSRVAGVPESSMCHHLARQHMLQQVQLAGWCVGALPAQCSFSECCSLPMPWHVVRESWRFLGQGVTPLRHLGCDSVVVTLSALSAWPKLH